MQWIVIEIVVNFIEAFIKVYFFVFFFGFRSKYKKRALIMCLATVFQGLLVTVMTLFRGFESIPGALVYVAVSTIFCIIFLNDGMFIKAIVAVCCESVIAIISYGTIGILVQISQKDFSTLATQQEVWRLVLIFVTKALFLFVVIIAIRIRNIKNVSFSKYEWLIIISIFICSMFLILAVTEISMIVPNNKEVTRFLLITVVGIIVINVAAIALTSKISKHNAEKTQMELLKIQLEQQTQSILDINDKYYSMVKIRHDVKKCLNCARALIESKEYKKAIDYLRSLEDSELLSLKKYVVTDNSIINALLNYQFSLCAEKNITVHCNISCSMQTIPEIDMSLLLANLIENAIEASKNVNNAHISLDIYDKINYQFIEISNKVAAPVLKKNPKLETTKKDKLKHGIGMHSIRDIVEKYEGTIDFYEKRDVFFCSVMLQKKGVTIEKIKA